MGFFNLACFAGERFAANTTGSLDAAASALDGVDGGSVGGETRRPDGGETDFVLGDFPDAVRTGSNDTDIVVFQQPGCGTWSCASSGDSAHADCLQLAEGEGGQAAPCRSAAVTGFG